MKLTQEAGCDNTPCKDKCTQIRFVVVKLMQINKVKYG